MTLTASPHHLVRKFEKVCQILDAYQRDASRLIPIDQEAFQKVLGFVPRMVAASLAAFWAGEFANAFVLARMKVLTGGRHLWARTIGSTVVGQAVDTALVMVLAFGGTLDRHLIDQANLVGKVSSINEQIDFFGRSYTPGRVFLKVFIKPIQQDQSID